MKTSSKAPAQLPLASFIQDARKMDASTARLVDQVADLLVTGDYPVSRAAVAKLAPEVGSGLLLGMAFRMARYAVGDYQVRALTGSKIESLLNRAHDPDDATVKELESMLRAVSSMEMMRMAAGVRLDLENTHLKRTDDTFSFLNEKAKVVAAVRPTVNDGWVVVCDLDDTATTVGLSQFSCATLKTFARMIDEAHGGPQSGFPKEARRIAGEKARNVREARRDVDAILIGKLSGKMVRLSQDSINRAVARLPRFDLPPPKLPANILRLPNLRQATSATCGAAATQAVLGYFGRSYLSESAVAKALNTSPDLGTRPEDIVRVLLSHNLKAIARTRMTCEDLEASVLLRQPVIVIYQAWKSELNPTAYRDDWMSGHYAVVIGVDDDYVYLEDPVLVGEIGVVRKPAFVERWHDISREGRPLVHFGITVSSDVAPIEVGRIAAVL